MERGSRFVKFVIKQFKIGTKPPGPRNALDEIQKISLSSIKSKLEVTDLARWFFFIHVASSVTFFYIPHSTIVYLTVSASIPGADSSISSGGAYFHSIS